MSSLRSNNLLTLVAIFLFLIPEAKADLLGIFQSISAGYNQLRAETDILTEDKKQVLTFIPNVTTSFVIGLETEYLAIGYSFAGEQKEFEQYDTSTFQDFRVNFRFDHFDFRLNIQKYQGGVSQDNNVTEFYDDYQVESKNIRAHYYLKENYLNFIRDGRRQTRKVANNYGINIQGSWFFGVNVDDRKIRLPQTLHASHQNLIDTNNIDYNNIFEALSYGPLVGYDMFLQLSRWFLRFKAAGGSVYQGDSNTAPQYEMTFATGIAFGENHLLSFSADSYMMEFKEESQRTRNNNVDVQIIYNYAF